VVFDAANDVPQEGVWITFPVVSGRLWLHLHPLHKYLDERLTAPKLPQWLVFLDGLPKIYTNELLRVEMGERLEVRELNDTMHPIERTFESKCSPQATPLGDPIPSATVIIFGQGRGESRGDERRTTVFRRPSMALSGVGDSFTSLASKAAK
jgi:hypothetical protein